LARTRLNNLVSSLVPRVSHLTAYELALGGKMRDPGKEAASFKDPMGLLNG